MSTQFGLQPHGVESSESGATLPYRLVGISDHATARAYVLSNVALSFGNWLLKDVKLQKTAYNIWDVTVEYASPENKQPAANSVKWTFDTTGQTKHLTQGLAHVATYAIAGRTAINHKGAIGVTDDSIEGVDVPDKGFRWTETWQLPASSYGFFYAATLGQLNGRMNASTFRGFAAYTVRFDGCSGGGLVGEDQDLREFTYNFAFSPSDSGLVVGDISGISKAGWDYLWTRYETADDASAKKSTPKPIQVEVDRVLWPLNFSLLGIGVGTLG